MKEALEKIKEAEALGQRRLAQAEQRAKEIGDGTAKEADVLLTRAEAEAGEKVKKLIEKAEELGRQKGDTLAAESRKELEKLKADAAKNSQKAVDLVVGRVLNG